MSEHETAERLAQLRRSAEFLNKLGRSNLVDELLALAAEQQVALREAYRSASLPVQPLVINEAPTDNLRVTPYDLEPVQPPRKKLLTCDLIVRLVEKYERDITQGLWGESTPGMRHILHDLKLVAGIPLRTTPHRTALSTPPASSPATKKVGCNRHQPVSAEQWHSENILKFKTFPQQQHYDGRGHGTLGTSYGMEIDTLGMLKSFAEACRSHSGQEIAPRLWTDQDLYDAYLHGCEDDCLPEPLDKDTFLAAWDDTRDVQ